MVSVGIKKSGIQIKDDRFWKRYALNLLSKNSANSEELIQCIFVHSVKES